MIDRHVQLTTYREQIYKIVKSHGLEGGLTIFHPFRQNEDMSFLPDGYVHFHVISVAFGNVRGGERGLGYVFKVIRDPSSTIENPHYRGIRTPGELRRCVKYQLTHCGLIKGRHAITWWGSLGYSGVSQTRLETDYPDAYADLNAKKNPRCPKCGSTDTENTEASGKFRWEISGSEANAKEWWRKEQLRKGLSDQSVELLRSYAPEY
jgi:hypothetical protein